MRWFDLETRSPADLRRVGVDNYADAMEGITLVVWADDDGPVQTWAPYHEPRPAALDAHPPGTGGWVAWNSRFDRAAWNACGFRPFLPVTGVLDAAAHAAAWGLPRALDKAAQALGLGRKHDSKAMRVIADPANPLPPLGSELWQTFTAYGRQDVALLRDIWRRLPPMSLEDAEQFWASERINDRGILVDLEQASELHTLAVARRVKDEAQLHALTGLNLGQSGALAQWVWDRLDTPARKLMLLGDRISPSLDAKRVLPNLLPVAPPEVAEVLGILSACRANPAAKFKALLARTSQLDGRLRGEYVFHGAPATGRFSSRGVQIHNLPRESPKDWSPAAMAQADTKELARYTRGCFIATADQQLSWCDWSAIEARVAPWLADTPGAGAVLDVFRRGEDLYSVVAARMGFDRPVGKVASLAQIFGGGVGALERMAGSLGVRIENPQAVVTAWREANAWAPLFWQKLWSAFHEARGGREARAGRIHCLPMSGGVLLRLPSGRVLPYQDVQWHRAEGEEQGQWIARGGKHIWPGLITENCVQAVAADLLREALVVLKDENIVGHTHDEILAEDVPPERLQQVMETPPIWAEGLPLAASTATNWFYGR